MQQLWNSPRFRIAVLAAIAVALIGLAVTRPTDPLGAPSEPDLILVELTTTTVATTSTTSTTTTTVPPALADERRQPLPAPVAVQPLEITTTTIDGRVRCPDLWAIITTVWPADQHANADLVAYKESRCQPDAVRARADWGVWQINQIHHGWLKADWGITREQLLDPMVNATAAYLIYQQGLDWYGCGWEPWHMSIDPDVLCG